MGACREDCFCHVEGDDGLVVDGVGTALDPFVTTPDEGRTIPMNVATYGALPTLDSAHVGMLAWLADEQNLRAWRDAPDGGWEEVSPVWRQTYPADISITSGTPDWSEGAEYLALTPGFWFICSNGVLDATMPTPGGIGVPGFQRDTVTTYAQLHDTANDAVIDTAEMNVDNFLIRTSEGDFGADRWVQIPYHLQNIVGVPLGDTWNVHLRGTRADISGGGTYDLTHLDLAAIRVANNDFTT